MSLVRAGPARAQLLPVARHFRLGTLPPGAVVAIAQIYLGNKKALFEYLHHDLKSILKSILGFTEVQSIDTSL